MHTWHHHLSWFLFGFSPCWVLVLVVIFMTRPSSPKTDFVWKICCVFRLENIIGPPSRWGPHLPMCGIPSIFVTLNISNKIGFTCFGVRTRKLLHFRIYRLFLFRKGLPFYIWFYPHMMDYDVALHNLEGLFIAIPTRPRTSKTESG